MRKGIIGFLLVAVVIHMVGCTGRQKGPAEYPIKGKVLAINREKPSVKLDHQDIPRGNVLQRRSVDPRKVPKDSATEVGDVVRALLERGPLQGRESLVQAAEDPPHGSLGADQRLQFPLDVAG